MPHAYTEDQLVEQTPKKRGGQKTSRWRVIEVRKPGFLGVFKERASRLVFICVGNVTSLQSLVNQGFLN